MRIDIELMKIHSVKHQLCWCEPNRLGRFFVSGMALATGLSWIAFSFETGG